jgi:hypothetical protein
VTTPCCLSLDSVRFLESCPWSSEPLNFGWHAPSTCAQPRHTKKLDLLGFLHASYSHPVAIPPLLLVSCFIQSTYRPLSCSLLSAPSILVFTRMGGSKAPFIRCPPAALTNEYSPSGSDNRYQPTHGGLRFELARWKGLSKYLGPLLPLLRWAADEIGRTSGQDYDHHLEMLAGAMHRQVAQIRFVGFCRFPDCICTLDHTFVFLLRICTSCVFSCFA